VADADLLADRFEAHRDHLRAVAYGLLGSRIQAEDAVQESWQRLHRTGGRDVDDLGRWLTAAVARVCLDMLRARAEPGPTPRVGLAFTIVDGRISAIDVTTDPDRFLDGSVDFDD
jgi:DNA-directed RNA polymerase specialized sigma24 family protein